MTLSLLKMAVNVIVDGLESGPLCLRGDGTFSVFNIRRIVTDNLKNNVSGISVSSVLRKF